MTVTSKRRLNEYIVLADSYIKKVGESMKEWIVTIYHDFGPVEIRCESINNALHVIKARREIFPGSIYKLAHKEIRRIRNDN